MVSALQSMRLATFGFARVSERLVCKFSVHSRKGQILKVIQAAARVPKAHGAAKAV